MASSEPQDVERHWVDFQAVVAGLDEEYEPRPCDLLCKAIRNGDMRTVRQKGLELRGSVTIPPKRQAIVSGRIDMLELLLQCDSLMDEELVKAACEQGDRQSLRLLLDSGWPINQPIEGASLLCTAIKDVKLMEWLVDNGADVNLGSRNDETALSFAIAYGNMDVIQHLLNRGTDLSRGDLVHCAAQRTNEVEAASLIEVLARKGVDVNTYRYNNNTAFRWRVFFRSSTALHIACKRRSVLIARTLLECGADPDRKMLEAQKPVPPTPYELAMESESEDLMVLFRAI